MLKYQTYIIVLFGIWLGFLGRIRADRIDRIVAVVDDEIILESEVMSHLAIEAMRLGMNRHDLVGSQGQTLFNKILENMVQEQLLLAKAREDTIQVDEDLVEEAVRVEINRIKEENGDSAFVQELYNQGMTERELRENFRKRMRNEGIRQQMFQILSQKIQVSPKENESFLNQYRKMKPELMSISHILIGLKPSSRRQIKAKKQAEDLLLRVRNGEDFSELARKFSQDPGTAPLGGDLGFFGRGQMVSGFEEVAFGLSPGEISDVLETEFGYHIIQVVDVVDDQVRARHILIFLRINDTDIKVAKQMASELYSRVQEGEDFSELAKLFSTHVETSGNGGRFPGIFSKENLPPAFKDTLGEMMPGEVSLPIKTEFGWHLVKLNDDQNTILEIFRQIRVEETFSNSMKEIRERLYVDIRI